jgi:hypothetical protein
VIAGIQPVGLWVPERETSVLDSTLPKNPLKQGRVRTPMILQDLWRYERNAETKKPTSPWQVKYEAHCEAAGRDSPVNYDSPGTHLVAS